MVAEAILVIEIEEVFEARTVAGVGKGQLYGVVFIANQLHPVESPFKMIAVAQAQADFRPENAHF